MTASLEILRETDRDDRLALIARTDHHPQRECATVGAVRRSLVSFEQTDLEAASILCTCLAGGEGCQENHIPQPAFVALPQRFLPLVRCYAGMQVGGDGG